MFGTICPSIFHMQIQDRFNSNSAMVHKGVPGAIAPVTTRMRYSLGVAQALGTKPKHTYNLFIFMEGSLLTFVKNTVPVLGRAPKMYISLHRSIHLREMFTQQLPFLKTYCTWYEIWNRSLVFQGTIGCTPNNVAVVWTPTETLKMGDHRPGRTCRLGHCGRRDLQYLHENWEEQ